MKMLLFALVCASQALAETSTSSIILTQNRKSQWSVTPSLTTGTLVQKIDTAHVNVRGSEVLTSGWIEQIRGEYGLSEAVSVGVGLGFEQVKSSFHDNAGLPPTINQNGMMDPVLFEKTQYALGTGTLKFGAQIGLSFEKHTFDAGLAQNVASGGFTAAPWVGYEVGFGPGVLGTRLIYQFMLTNQKWHYEAGPYSGPEHDSTVSGGQMLRWDGFYEWMISPRYSLGVDVSYGDYATEKETDQKTGQTLDRTNGTAAPGFAIYGLWLASLNPVIAIIPAFEYGGYPTTVTGFVQSQQVSLFSLYGRYYF